MEEYEILKVTAVGMGCFTIGILGGKYLLNYYGEKENLINRTREDGKEKIQESIIKEEQRYTSWFFKPLELGTKLARKRYKQGKFDNFINRWKGGTNGVKKNK